MATRILLVPLNLEDHVTKLHYSNKKMPGNILKYLKLKVDSH